MTDQSLDEKIDRLEQLIDRLETEELSLQEAQRLHDDATALLEELEAELDIGDGSVTELDGGQ
ncbi:Exonuclease VII small subunit (plasmid) [Halalkaliarchaeum sp. AArc-CO]|uniref:exodeoxyribonuclease VII small subunit n=1 Tax=Halalkaliarchaeum sp. AArc-CO TaxID=2866381 RepID=UPI00217EECC4|nr:exodeoxyribonuclease VII small subunit [Halalkaliarchaeum sp. AArc-CO]UWG49292.1 Exonuclease VII small subunit [Halalkaliarchaeum sp. AArc-CO]